MLVIGPTGSGKTPLGRMLENRGYRGKKCVHFDFGERLRQAAAQGNTDGLDEEDRDLVRGLLRAGKLLEEEHFYIAATILRRFLTDHNADEAGGPDGLVEPVEPVEPVKTTLVVLNGLPRHVGQARDVDSIVEVVRVVHLTCSVETVCQRIGSNAGGDRLGRTDDDIEAVGAKLAIFAARTAPLIDHYRGIGAEIHTVPVGPATTAEDAWNALHGS